MAEELAPLHHFTCAVSEAKKQLHDKRLDRFVPAFPAHMAAIRIDRQPGNAKREVCWSVHDTRPPDQPIIVF
jgi:hypothetical protein